MTKKFIDVPAFDFTFYFSMILHVSFSLPLNSQNPKNCSTARKLFCSINKACGYGCQIHHVLYCFILAYGTQRTLVLQSNGWKYSTRGWERLFMPLSDTCTDRFGERTLPWGGTYLVIRRRSTQALVLSSDYPRCNCLWPEEKNSYPSKCF